MQVNIDKYKLTWVDPLNADQMYSKFFSSLVDMTYYIQTLDKKFNYMVFEYVSYVDGTFTWKLLPFGSYQSYKRGMLINEYKEIIIVGIILLYFLVKK